MRTCGQETAPPRGGGEATVPLGSAAVLDRRRDLGKILTSATADVKRESRKTTRAARRPPLRSSTAARWVRSRCPPWSVGPPQRSRAGFPTSTCFSMQPYAKRRPLRHMAAVAHGPRFASKEIAGPRRCRGELVRSSRAFMTTSTVSHGISTELASHHSTTAFSFGTDEASTRKRRLSQREMKWHPVL